LERDAVPAKAKKNLTQEDYLTREEYRARFDAEKLAVQRHYCTLFRFWRSCRHKPCRRARACAGDPHACLQSRIGAVLRDRQFAARQSLLHSTPRNLPAPERAARAIFPNTFADASAAFRAQDIPAGWTRSARRRKA
jgi:hypothetical protein